MPQLPNRAPLHVVLPQPRSSRTCRATRAEHATTSTSVQQAASGLAVQWHARLVCGIPNLDRRAASAAGRRGAAMQPAGPAAAMQHPPCTCTRRFLGWLLLHAWLTRGGGCHVRWGGRPVGPVGAKALPRAHLWCATPTASSRAHVHRGRQGQNDGDERRFPRGSPRSAAATGPCQRYTRAGARAAGCVSRALVRPLPPSPPSVSLILHQSRGGCGPVLGAGTSRCARGCRQPPPAFTPKCREFSTRS